jgi:prepilin-type N-terminal cleavage/methylation domain-containing protein
LSDFFYFKEKYNMKKQNIKAFTLIELLIVVAILGVISAIAVPVYNDYIKTAKQEAAKNSLRSIALAQVEYRSENNTYYGTSSSPRVTPIINRDLFSNNKTLDESGDYYYWINRSGSGFTAYAQPKTTGSLIKLCINQNNNLRDPC